MLPVNYRKNIYFVHINIKKPINIITAGKYYLDIKL